MLVRTAGLVVAIGCGGQGRPPPAVPPSAGGGAVAAPQPEVPLPAAATAPGVAPDPGQPADAAFAARAEQIVDVFTNTSAAFTRDGKRIVFVSDRDGLPQLYLAAAPGAPATRVVTTTERVLGPSVAPGGRDVVFLSDRGADENWSIWRVGLDGQHLVELTPGEPLQRDTYVIPDGKPSRLFFSARAQAETRSTLYVTPAVEPGTPRAIYTDDHTAYLLDVSADARRALMLEFWSRSEQHLIVVDVASGKPTPLYPAPADGKAAVFDARFTRDGGRVIVATDGGAEQALVLAVDARTGAIKARRAIQPATAQIRGLAVAKEGHTFAVTVRAGNHDEVQLFHTRSLAPRAVAKLPLGEGGAAEFSEDGRRLAVQWSTPRSPTDVFAVDARAGEVTALREDARPSLAALPPLDVQTVEVPAFDGGVIPTNVYQPTGTPGAAATARHPVVVMFHGGPPGTAVIRWSPINAFLLSLGYVIVEPNVRGSAGFGRAFEQADDGRKRLDAFHDIETVVAWVTAQPWADPARLIAAGSSYGGYETLVALTRWPDRWRAGIDLFGLVNLESFMATTSGSIHDAFVTELGDPTKDAAFLREISPLTAVDRITAPTFVYAGANDPRVPRGESDQIVKALRGRKVPVEYMVAANEGHSLARRDTKIALFARMARFLEHHLANRSPGQ